MKNLDYIISSTILKQVGDFDDTKITEEIIHSNNLSIDFDELFDKVVEKIDALFNANVITYDGYSTYYLNENYKK